MSSKRMRYDRIALVERNADEEEESSEEGESDAESGSEQADDDTRSRPSNHRAEQQTAKQGKIHVALNKSSDVVCHVRILASATCHEREVTLHKSSSTAARVVARMPVHMQNLYEQDAAVYTLWKLKYITNVPYRSACSLWWATSDISRCTSAPVLLVVYIPSLMAGPAKAHASSHGA